MYLGIMLPFCGVIIFGAYYLWLRRKQVDDHSLLWLAGCLLALLPATVVQCLNLNPATGKPLLFMASAISNVVSVATAFHLLRVREALRKRGKLSYYITWAFAGAAALVWVLMGLVLGGRLSPGVTDTTGYIDAMSSCLSILVLMSCMSYSFYMYGNWLMIALTLCDFGYVFLYQLYLFKNGNQLTEQPFHIALNITSTAFMTMLFIALTLAWGLSNTSRLKFRGFEHVTIIAMCIDLRGSTAYTADAFDKGVSDIVVDFTNKFCQWVMGVVSKTMEVPPTVKFVGDGMVLVWEAEGTKFMDDATAVAGLACALDGGYSKWRSSGNPEWKNHVPRYIGIGVDFGDQARRFTSESGSYEYLGLPLSYAAKMQAMARPNGGVVIRDKWTLPDYLRCKFTKSGTMFIGDERIPVRATGRVKFNPSQNGQPHPTDEELN
ncbi:MAG: hypothetical protein JOZ02_05885 [Acidobacteria bacterium]|nr:hypothetical protein [Acidobacteriota bacterium]